MPNKSLSRSSLLSFQKYSSLLAGNDPFDPGDYYLLASEVLTGSQSSITFSSVNTLAADFQHLQIRWTARTTSQADIDDQINLRFNSTASNQYARRWMRGDGGAVSGSAGVSQNEIWAGWAASQNAAANRFGAGVTDILDPFKTTKNTTTRALVGVDGFGIAQLSGLWMNTAAVTTITLTSNVGASFVAGSRFSIYGLKAV